MIVFWSVLLAFLVDFTTCQTHTPAQYEGNIKFYGFKGDSLSSMFVSTFNNSIAEQGCDPNGPFAMIIHGWKEGFYSTFSWWANTTILNLLKYRGGCVFYMDYSKYSIVNNYFDLTPHFKGISAVLLKKFRQIGNYENQYCFGFSFGSWLCTETGKALGNQLIGRMDVCDPAGYGFDLNIDPKPAAKNVACIHTSIDKGTRVYNCHQNFRMGYCGEWQLAGLNALPPLGSHGLCPVLYNLAFTMEYVSTNNYKCGSGRLAKNLSNNVRMGYMGNFNRTLVQGDIFIATAKYPDYRVINGTLENKKPT